jgi:hypothetical protein
MRGFPASDKAPDIYWGPDLEILGRVYKTPRRGRLPLWYHHGASVRERDGAEITRQLELAHYEWIVTTSLWGEIPTQARDYILKDYDRVVVDDIIFFHRIRQTTNP